MGLQWVLYEMLRNLDFDLQNSEHRARKDVFLKDHSHSPLDVSETNKHTAVIVQARNGDR